MLGDVKESETEQMSEEEFARIGIIQGACDRIWVSRQMVLLLCISHKARIESILKIIELSVCAVAATLFRPMNGLIAAERGRESDDRAWLPFRVADPRRQTLR
jgi:hypothetical protein